MTIETLTSALESARARLNTLVPDPNGKHEKAAVGALVDDVRRNLLSPLSQALGELAENEAQTRLRDAVLYTALDATGLAFAAGDDDAGRRLLRDLRGAAPNTPADAEAAAAADAPRAFALLTWGRWLHGKKQYGKSERALNKALSLLGPATAASSSSTPNPSGAPSSVRPASATALRDLVQQALDAPRPIDKAPGLATVNGIGQTLHGKRDVWSDGSYVTTLWFTFFFVPIFPIAAYRVQPSGSGAWRFYFATRLGPIARWWGRGVVAVGAAAVVVVTATSWWSSPERRFDAACSAAEAKASTGDVDGAIADLGDALRTISADNDARKDAGRRIFALRAATLPTPRAVADVERLLRDASAVPADARDGADVKAAVIAFLDDNAAADVAVRHAVVDRALRVLPDDADLKQRNDQLAILDLQVLAKTWPAKAAVRLGAYASDAAKAARQALLDAAPSAGARAVVVDDAAAALARKDVVADDATPAARRAFLKAHPDDQVVAALVVGDAYDAGALDVARAAFAAVGPVGWWSDDLLAMGADLAANDGDVERADAMLDVALHPSLEAFIATQDALVAEMKRIDAALLARANDASNNDDDVRRLRAADEATQQTLLSEMFDADVAKSATVKRLRDDSRVLGAVVSRALQSGGLKLRRAASAAPEQQAALLKAAEDAFVAVANVASDDPRFRLGLGEVKYRTQQAAEGKKLFDAYIADGGPGDALDVAYRLRELGAEADARSTTEAVLAKGGEFKDAAAALLVLMSRTLDERERYLAMVEKPSDHIEALRAQARASRFMLEKKPADAERELRKVVHLYEKNAATEDGAANNAALAWSEIYALTGDAKALASASTLMERARRFTPLSAIVADNLLSISTHRANLELLAPLLDLKALRLSDEEAAGVVGASNVVDEAKARMSGGRLRALAEEVRTLSPGSASAYSRLLYVYADDVAALDRLAALMDKNPIDLSGGQKAWDDRKENAKRQRENNDAALAALDARSVVGPRNVAVVSLLRGFTLLHIATIEHDDKKAQQAVDAFVAASDGWKDLDTAAVRADALVRLALLRAAQSSTALQAMVDDDPWFDDAMLFRIVKGADDVKAAVAARPELKEALALRNSAKEPSSRGWAIATLLGDAASVQKHAPSLAEPSSVRFRAIAARLAPWDADKQAALQLK